MWNAFEMAAASDQYMLDVHSIMEIVGCELTEAAEMLERSGTAEAAINTHFGQADARSMSEAAPVEFGEWGYAPTLAEGAPPSAAEHHDLPRAYVDWQAKQQAEEHAGKQRQERLIAKYNLKLRELFVDEQKLVSQLFVHCSKNQHAELRDLLESIEWKEAANANPYLISHYWPCTGMGLDTTDDWPLLECVKSDAHECAELLLLHGSSVDAPLVCGGDDVLHSSGAGTPADVPSPLVYAAEWGDYPMVELLVRHGAVRASPRAHPDTHRGIRMCPHVHAAAHAAALSRSRAHAQAPRASVATPSASRVSLLRVRRRSRA